MRGGRNGKVALVGKNPPVNAGDLGSIPALGRSPGGGHGSPLQCSCPENPLDRGAWLITVHGVTKELDKSQRLSTHVDKDSTRLFKGMVPRVMHASWLNPPTSSWGKSAGSPSLELPWTSQQSGRLAPCVYATNIHWPLNIREFQGK